MQLRESLQKAQDLAEGKVAEMMSLQSAHEELHSDFKSAKVAADALDAEIRRLEEQVSGLQNELVVTVEALSAKEASLAVRTAKVNDLGEEVADLRASLRRRVGRSPPVASVRSRC